MVMKNRGAMTLTLGGILIALSQVLSYIKIWQMPQGGAVTIGSMVPILIFVLIAKPGPAFIATFAYGFLQFAIGGDFLLNPASIFLDYILAFGILGIATFFPKNLPGALIGSALAILARYACHVLSGVLIFYMYAPEGVSPLVYSLVYNTFLLVELAITIVILAVLYKPVVKNFEKRLGSPS